MHCDKCDIGTERNGTNPSQISPNMYYHVNVPFENYFSKYLALFSISWNPSHFNLPNQYTYVWNRIFRAHSITSQLQMSLMLGLVFLFMPLTIVKHFNATFFTNTLNSCWTDIYILIITHHPILEKSNYPKLLKYSFAFVRWQFIKNSPIELYMHFFYTIFEKY